MLTDFSTAMAIVAAYLLMVALGPTIMSKLQPIDSYPVRFVYNMVQVTSKGKASGVCSVDHVGLDLFRVDYFNTNLRRIVQAPALPSVHTMVAHRQLRHRG